MANLSNPANIKKLLDAQTLSINSNVDTKTTAVSSAVTTKATETQTALITDNDVTQATLNAMTTVNGTLDTNVTAINSNTNAKHVTTDALVTSEANRVIAANPSAIKSIQRGSALMSNTSINITVASINPAKSFLIFSFVSPASTAAQTIKGQITNNTMLYFNSNTFNHSVSWQVIEYV